MRPAALLVGAAVAALLLFSRRSSAATLPGQSDGWDYGPGDDLFAPGEYDMALTDDTGYSSEPYTPDPIDAGGLIDAGGWPFGGTMEAINANRRAFLYMIRSAEHRWPDDVDSGLAYQTFYGGSRFQNLSDHPVITREKQGVPLPANFCRAAGFASGVCVSTAAGAYQFTKPTWAALKSKLRLPDFSPASQDAAALELLREIGALRYVDAGQFQAAIQVASKRWASLPGSTAQQGGKSTNFLMARLDDAFQAIAAERQTQFGE